MDNQINSWVNSDPKKHIQNFIKQIKAKEKWLDEELLLSMHPLNIISAFLVAFIAKKSFPKTRELFSVS